MALVFGWLIYAVYMANDAAPIPEGVTAAALFSRRKSYLSPSRNIRLTDRLSFPIRFRFKSGGFISIVVSSDCTSAKNFLVPEFAFAGLAALP